MKILLLNFKYKKIYYNFKSHNKIYLSNHKLISKINIFQRFQGKKDNRNLIIQIFSL